MSACEESTFRVNENIFLHFFSYKGNMAKVRGECERRGMHFRAASFHGE